MGPTAGRLGRRRPFVRLTTCLSGPDGRPATELGISNGSDRCWLTSGPGFLPGLILSQPDMSVRAVNETEIMLL